MSNILTVLEQLSFLHILWLFFLAFVIHELEEWNINQFEHRNFVGAPAQASDRSVRMWIACVCLIGLGWCTLATLPGNSALAAWIFLPAVAIMVQNALQHIYWSFYFRQLAPGIFTAVILLIPLGGYILLSAVQQGYAPFWYALICAGLIATGFIQTIRAGNKMPALIRAVNVIGIALSERIK